MTFRLVEGEIILIDSNGNIIDFITDSNNIKRVPVDADINVTVNTVSHADNPIHLSAKKIIATDNWVTFIDENIPANIIWYISTIIVGGEDKTFFEGWKGLERNRVETYSGNGSAKNFPLDYGCIDIDQYVSVVVDSATLTRDVDYWVEEHDTDIDKSKIRFNTAPSSSSNNVIITYDASTRITGLASPKDSSVSSQFIGAPVKLTSGQFLVIIVKSHDSSAGIVYSTINGFSEVV